MQIELHGNNVIVRNRTNSNDYKEIKNFNSVCVYSGDQVQIFYDDHDKFANIKKNSKNRLIVNTFKNQPEEDLPF